MRRDDGQRFDLVEPRRVDAFQQIFEGVEVVGHLSEQWLIDIESYSAAQALDLVL
jgi:hypothetical protein